MMIRKILLACVLFIFTEFAYAKIYNSEANDCLTRPDIKGTLIVHLNSARSGVFSHVNGCWWMASGDIKFQQFNGTLVAISTWVALQYIDFKDDYESYPRPDELKPGELVNGSVAFNYYKSSHEYVCQQTNTICENLDTFTPRYRMLVKELRNIHSYYNCQITDADYPLVGDSYCYLNKQYYIENSEIYACSSNPVHPVCVRNNTSNNGNSNNENNNSNNANNNNNSGNNNNSDNSNSHNNHNSGGNNNNSNEDNDDEDEDDFVDINVITNELSNINTNLLIISNNLIKTNDNVLKITNNTSSILSLVDNIDETANNILNNTSDINRSTNELVTGQRVSNNILSGISKTDNAILTEAKKLHSDINKNHNELLSKLNSNSNGNSGNSNNGIGDFTDADANSLNSKFNDSASIYEDKSISYVESALSKLSNSIPDLSLMFKLPDSFYGGNSGMCKSLSTNLDFKFPYSSQRFSLKFDTSDFCQHYDKNFRGIVDFMLAFMTALAVFRLYHRYNSSH